MVLLSLQGMERLPNPCMDPYMDPCMVQIQDPSRFSSGCFDPVSPVKNIIEKVDMYNLSGFKVSCI